MVLVCTPLAYLVTKKIAKEENRNDRLIAMKYKDTVRARFIERENRFSAKVCLEGKEETVHVKNTGRCRELLLPGSLVILSDGKNPARKTRYDLITVWKDGLGWVNIDSQAPNAVVKEWLEGTEEERPEELKHLTRVHPEYTFGNSRIDFYLESGTRKILMEVKGCTLEIGGIGYFPDAPTKRGVKHMHELAAAAEEGYECYIAFVIAMPGITEVRPNLNTHPEFGKALEEAKKAGVKVLFLQCEVTEDSLKIKK